MIRFDPDNPAPDVPSPPQAAPRPGLRRRAARMVKVVPSLLTLGNLLMGFAAIFYASRDPEATRLLPMFSPLTIAAACIFIGMIFDALDGRVARMTRQTSELGEQLDSMADMVTFGVAPAFLVIQLVGIGTPFFGEEVITRWDVYFDRTVLVVAGVYVACTALRLARYNIELDQPIEADHMSFKGLPSPAAAGTVASFVILHQSLLADSNAAKWTAIAMVGIGLLVAIAMVSTMRYVHLLNRYLRGRAPFHYVATAVLLLIPLLIVPQLTLAVGFGIYAMSAPLVYAFRKSRGERTLEDEEDEEDAAFEPGD